jgi:hypothetical protein
MVFSHLRLSLPQGTLQLGFSTRKFVCVLHALPWSASSIIFRKEYKLWRSPRNFLSSFYILFLAPAVTLALRYQTTPPPPFGLCSSRLSRDGVSHPYKTKWDLCHNVNYNFVNLAWFEVSASSVSSLSSVWRRVRKRSAWRCVVVNCGLFWWTWWLRGPR